MSKYSETETNFKKVKELLDFAKNTPSGELEKNINSLKLTMTLLRESIARLDEIIKLAEAK